METPEKSWKCCCCSLAGFPLPEEIPEYAGGHIFLLLFSLVAGCPSLTNGSYWGGTNLLGPCISHHWFSVYRTPVLFLKGQVLGKLLPSAHHTSVSLQRSLGLGLVKLLRETDYSCPFGHLQKPPQLQRSGQLRSVLHSCCPAILGIPNLVSVFSCCFFFYCFKFLRLFWKHVGGAEIWLFICVVLPNCIPRLCPPG